MPEPSGVEAATRHVRFWWNKQLRYLQRAAHNLRRLQLVGTTEELPRFARAFHRRIGLALRIPRRNQAPESARDPRRQVSPALRKRVEALCAPDRRVYEQVRSTIQP